MRPKQVSSASIVERATLHFLFLKKYINYVYLYIIYYTQSSDQPLFS